MPVRSERVRAPLAGADPDHVVDRDRPDLAVADLAGLGALDDHVDDLARRPSSSTSTSIRTLGTRSTVYSAPR